MGTGMFNGIDLEKGLIRLLVLACIGLIAIVAGVIWLIVWLCRHVTIV